MSTEEQEVKISFTETKDGKFIINYTQIIGNSEIELSEIVNTDDDVNGFF